MNFTDYTLNQIRQLEPNFLERSRKNTSTTPQYICPKCGHGKGGDGITISPGTRQYKCFSCGICEDIIGLYELHYGADFKTAVTELARQNNIELSNKPIEGTKTTKAHKHTPKPVESLKTVNKELTKEVRELDRDTYLYLSARGLTQDTINKFNLYSKDNMLCIPYPGVDYKTKRTTRGDKKYFKDKGTMPIFNLAQATNNTSNIIYVVEGEIDAISLAQCGGNAIALGGVTGVNKLVNHVKNNIDVYKCKVFILALDQDKPGQETSNKLQTELSNIGVCNTIADWTQKDKKDANEMLINNKNMLIEDVQKQIKAASTLLNNTDTEIETDKELASLHNTNVKQYIDLFLKAEIEEFSSSSSINTGFNRLDSVLGGGLHSGLYVLGAESSLGKTTLALQIAEQVAESGIPVVFFSLEQTRLELVSKGLNRLYHTDYTGKQKRIDNALYTSINFRRAEVDNSIVRDCLELYTKRANNLYIVEGDFNFNIATMDRYLDTFTKINKVKPVVIVDYLQILEPKESKKEGKQVLDQAIKELKLLQTQHKITMLAISSFNRNNYNKTADFTSFNGSGLIEYSADCVLTLELSIVANGTGDLTRQEVREEKAKDVRSVVLNIIKNRYGVACSSVKFNYEPKKDLFLEEKETKEEETISDLELQFSKRNKTGKIM